MIDLRDDNAKSTAGGGKYGNLNIPVSSQQGLAPLSPYLNFDPAYLPPSQPEYIFPEGAVKQRGRFELAFSQIGAACIIGAALGGTSGMYRGLKATASEGQTGKLRRTQLINHVTKSGSSLANTFGILTVMYSGFGVILSWARGTDDSLNTFGAAIGTGMLFKSTSGLRKCALGGCIGLGIASLYCLWTNRENLRTLGHRDISPAFQSFLEDSYATFGPIALATFLWYAVPYICSVYGQKSRLLCWDVCLVPTDMRYRSK